jgi:hypothetical protein
MDARTSVHTVMIENMDMAPSSGMTGESIEGIGKTVGNTVADFSSHPETTRSKATGATGILSAIPASTT